MPTISQRLLNLERMAKQSLSDHQRNLSQYRTDPVGYCRDVLQVTLTPRQEEIARALVEPPYRVLVRAAHGVGKSFVAACLVNFWFDVHPESIVLTTAPTDRQVRSILWKEIRILRGRRGGFAGPKVCRLESGPSHWAEGFTARDGTRFQGHHGPATLIVFDEAEGVDGMFWEAAEPMLGGGNACGFLAIYNPTSQTSPTVEEERSGRYRVIVDSCLDHPNIAAELAGQAPPFPSAIRLERLEEMLARWSTAVQGEPLPGDVQLRGRTYRPGPVAQSRLLGRRPSIGFDSVWSEALFEQVCQRELPLTGPLQVGCDVARFGDDDTCWHIRKGGVSLGHYRRNGLSISQSIGESQILSQKWAAQFGLDHRRDVVIVVDDCGVGGGVTDGLRANGFRVAAVNVGTAAPQPEQYPNLRSCLWFEFAEAAACGNVSFARLSREAQAELRRELLAPQYSLDIRGRRVVEPKVTTKARLGRSPDAADAVHLAYCNVSIMPARVSPAVEVAE